MQNPAEEFVARYEAFWRSGARDLDSVYTPDAILCGFEIVKSTQSIGRILEAIISQGWREISIEIIATTITGHMILLACRYSARSDREEMTAKSSYVLVQQGNVWKAAMHTAT